MSNELKVDKPNSGQNQRAGSAYKKRTKQVVEDENKSYQHRCALEHSDHFKMMQQNGYEAAKKLLVVAIISFIFMSVEAIGGYWSGSLAILTDAAHQASDVAGFAISWIAVWVTRYSSTLKYSYGYHRADAIGALATVMIIWALLIWLLAEAVMRLITPAEEINGEIMLITACLGLGCNVTNLIVLQCCFSEEDEEGKPKPLLGSIASAYKPNGGATYGYAGSRLGSKLGSVRGGSVIAGMGSLRGTVKSGSRRPANPKSERLLKNGEEEKPIQHKVRKIDHSKDLEKGKYDEKHAENEEHKQLLATRRTGSLTLDKSQREELLNQEEFKKSSLHGQSVQGDKHAPDFVEVPGKDRKKSADAVEVHSINEEDQLGAGASPADDAAFKLVKDDGIMSVRIEEKDKEIENMNVRAAIIHMVGDIISSIGVVIAALIIYLQPTWTIADPICTFLFSIMVLLTTVPIFTDVMRILMETTPADVEIVDLFNAMSALNVVDEIHDFHVYSLGEGKPILSAHVVTDVNPSYALYKITELCQNEFDIHHTTIQIEPNKKSHMRGDGTEQLRCINEHAFVDKIALAKDHIEEELNSQRLLKSKKTQ